MNPIGVIGKTNLDDREQALMFQFGRVIARAEKELVIVPASGTAGAVEVGCKAEGGKVTEITKGIFAAAAHVFVYADERLMMRLRSLDPNIDYNSKVTLLSSPLEIEMWLDAARRVLSERGLKYPE